jgi:hypothetical protein
MIAHKKPWCMVPSEPLIPLLPKVKWQSQGEAPASTNAAALMLYVALNFAAEREEDDAGNYRGRAALSYNALSDVVSLSRATIAHGLNRLIALRLVERFGSDQKRGYLIHWTSRGWFKLPCKAVLNEGTIAPFAHFSLRTKAELNALKLYLYLAGVRSNDVHFSMSSHATIHTKTGIPENDIRRAHSLLTSVGLLAAVERDHLGIVENYSEPNKYYLTGYKALCREPS